MQRSRKGVGQECKVSASLLLITIYKYSKIKTNKT